MATRKTIITVVTDALKDDFDNVVNKFITPAELLDRTQVSGQSKFPWLNVALGSHTAALDLSGTLEVEQRVPIIIVGYEKSKKTAGDLQIRIAELADSIVSSLTSQTHANTFCTNNFGIESIQLLPAEDEEHYEIGILTARVMAVSGD